MRSKVTCEIKVTITGANFMLTKSVRELARYSILIYKDFKLINYFQS